MNKFYRMNAVTFSAMFESKTEICISCDRAIKPNATRCCSLDSVFDVESLLDAEMIVIDDYAKRVTVVTERSL